MIAAPERAEKPAFSPSSKGWLSVGGTLQQAYGADGTGLAPRVLVVEDVLLNRLLAKMLLESAEFRVEVAENGAVALDVCEGEEAFDLILMDLDMPVMDGFEATVAIRQLGAAKGAAVPILALSAMTHPEAIARARAAGMDGHLRKPYDPKHFVRDVRRALAPAAAPAPASTIGSAQTPVWNREPFEDYVRRLGAARMAKHVELFGAKLARVRAALIMNPADHGHLTWEAHALVSSAGTLGFEELGELSAKAQRLTQDADIRSVSLGLVAAIDRVLAELAHALPGTSVSPNRQQD